MKPSLAVDLGGVRLPTPVMVASGCFGWGRELSALVDVGKFGGVVTPSITLHPVPGHPTPRMVETASGLLASIGLQNPGVEEFLDRHLPELGQLGIPVFASVAGTRVEEYVRVAARLSGARGITAVEANLACPNAERAGELFASRPDWAGRALAAVARVSRLPVFAKLAVEAADIVEVAQACVRAGARGLTLIGAVQGMAVDVEDLRAALASITGGLSGPAIRPIAARAVFQVARAMPELPIIGVGGVGRTRDALELLLAGAWAVQVGTAVFTNPSAPIEIARGIAEFLEERGLPSPAALRGLLRGPEGPIPEARPPGDRSSMARG